MITVKLKLSKELEKHLIYLETISKRSKDFIIKEALIQYLEDAEDIAEYYKKAKENGGKIFTSEELNFFLEKKNLKEIENKTSLKD
ncbi:MAG: hypothetical protein I3273_04790 [Candidatus Moeniiplasma glomeromycotorum]|nr:hypothetical protein [Candidatus Moeniiplasma glomeromycotorum]MCE8169408.1 hypothetical protein [Candidatus Moeniiplasma glomeromycotorum]